MAFKTRLLFVLAVHSFFSGTAQQPVQGLDVYDRGEGLMFKDRAEGHGLQFRAWNHFSSEVRTLLEPMKRIGAFEHDAFD